MQTHKAKILIFVAFSLIAFDQIMAIETPKYKLIKKESGFEVRDYGPMIVASTSVESNYSDAASIGFRRIAGYIFGGNSAGMKIDMTAPVITNTPATRETYEIQFIMPSKHSFKDLPKPSAGNVSIKNIPEIINVVRKLLVSTQRRPIIAPILNEPVSPIKIFAGNLLNFKKPKHIPDIEKDRRL